MRARERERQALHTLAAMPFLDYLELAAVSGMAESTARHVLGRLRRDGLADSIRHSSPLTATTRRWFVTVDGLRSLASENGTGIERLLRTRPVSAHWRRILLARLDAVAVVYRLASAAADAVGPSRFRWYRAAPLDAAMTLPDSRTVGVIRQGPTSDRTSISDRIRRLLDPQQSRPRALLALMPDAARLSQVRRLLARYPGPVYLILEKDVSGMVADDRVWHAASAPNLLSLSEILAHLRPGGTLPWEASASRLALPDDADLRRVDDGVPDHLLPAVFKPAEKRMLDWLADWPLITAADLGGILGLSPSGVSKLTIRLGEFDLVSIVALEGRRRLALSDRGLAVLARRDRVSVGAGCPCTQGPGLRGGCLSSLERRANRRRVSHVLAGRPRRAKPLPCPDHRPHPGRAPVHGGAGAAGGGDAGLFGFAVVPAASRSPVLPVRRKPPLHPPRRLRSGARQRALQAFLPRMGAQSAQSFHHGRSPRPLPALLLLQPTSGRPRGTPPGVDRLRRPPGRGELPRRCPQGDGTPQGQAAPLGFP